MSRDTDYLEIAVEIDKFNGKSFCGVQDGLEAGKKARDEEHKMWEKNAEKLRDGEFGELSDLSTLVRYWEAQESANYPEANYNVKEFQNMVDKMKEEKQ